MQRGRTRLSQCWHIVTLQLWHRCPVGQRYSHCGAGAGSHGAAVARALLEADMATMRFGVDGRICGCSERANMLRSYAIDWSIRTYIYIYVSCINTCIHIHHIHPVIYRLRRTLRRYTVHMCLICDRCGVGYRLTCMTSIHHLIHIHQPFITVCQLTCIHHSCMYNVQWVCAVM